MNFCKKNENNKRFDNEIIFFKLINEKTKIISRPLKKYIFKISKKYTIIKFLQEVGIIKLLLQKNSDSVCYPV